MFKTRKTTANAAQLLPDRSLWFGLACAWLGGVCVGVSLCYPRLHAPPACVASGLPLAGGIIGAGGEITWPAPTRPGDILHVESEVMEVGPSRSRPERSRGR